MPARKDPTSLGDWIVDNSKILMAIAAAAATFYFTVKFTLDKHEAQFAEIAKTFDKFNKTQDSNYADYAKNQKDESAVREKMREQFTALFTQLTASSAGTNAQVNAIVKQLDGVTTKIDSIQNVQRERRR